MIPGRVYPRTPVAALLGLLSLAPAFADTHAAPDPANASPAVTGPAKAPSVPPDSALPADAGAPRSPEVPDPTTDPEPDTPAPPPADAGQDSAPPGPLVPPPGSTPAIAAPAPDARTLLARLWRADVAADRTQLGFEGWLAAALETGTPPVSTGTPSAAATGQGARTRAVSGSWLTRTGPVALGEAGRVVTTFGAAIPVAYCSPLTVCYVELEPGEVLSDTPSWGDTVRWQVVAKVQGADPETVILEIKPARDAGHTNLVIPTDRRLYTITLVNDAEVHTPILSFHYPDTAARRIAEGLAAQKAQKARDRAASDKRRREAAAATAAALARSGVPTEDGPRAAGDLDFGFRVDGKAPFKPVRVFTDGRRTYIDLHPGYRGALPAIVAGSGEGNAALNTRVSAGGSRIVADRVITDVWLQSGRTRVRIRRAGR
ncbi:TrbG/VirB9 family P-type conjugative transfer protein [Tateyamaria sp.]|uniref:TrbG/VirB9 family P-type conjugative transfer protein n=1 Tax=Tateyamaria sp. TaxID=1929288 RepID=UPI003B219C5B